MTILRQRLHSQRPGTRSTPLLAHSLFLVGEWFGKPGLLRLLSSVVESSPLQWTCVSLQLGIPM